MVPDVGRSSPPRRWSNVDLPEPDLPSRAIFSPARTSSVTPRKPQTRTDLPDVHSLVTSHNRTAWLNVAGDTGAGEKRDIGSASVVRCSLSLYSPRDGSIQAPSASAG